MRPYGRPRRSEGYFGPEGRRPKAGIGGPASVEGVLTPISSRIISDRLDLYKGAFQSLFILYLVHHPDIQILLNFLLPPNTKLLIPEFIILPLCDC